MKKASPKVITQDQLIDALKKATKNSFAFLIGSGASVTSGIPAGGTLARKWLSELEEILKDGFEKWESSVVIDKPNKFTEGNSAQYYSDIYKKRFEACEQNGYDEIVSLMDNAQPSLGYLFFAQAVIGLNHNHIITTNFDHLIEDSLFFATTSRPLVVGHESLASHITITTERPTIMKVHRDMFFTPFSTDDNTERMQEEWINALKPILNNCNLVVLGYGGNDGSVMDFLKEIEPRKPIYWCSRGSVDQLDHRIINLLQTTDYAVEYEGFDELMYAIHNSCGLPDLIHPVKSANEKASLVSIAENRVKEYQLRFKKLEDTSIKRTQKGEKISSSVENMFDSETQAILYAYEAKTDNEKELRFKKAILKFPQGSDVHGYFAVFLEDIRKDYEQAKTYYTKALEIDPNNYIHTGNYALMLHEKLEDYEEADIYYRKAIELGPYEAYNIGNYANLLSFIHENLEQAEFYYKKALELEPNDPNYNGNYASFLRRYRKDYNQAEVFYKKALKLDPDHSINNGNYALFLQVDRQNYDLAEVYYKRALNLESDNVIHVINYATFLDESKKDNDLAEVYYKRALELNPNDSDNNIKFANFLRLSKENYDLAEFHYKKALELDSENIYANGSYAVFLSVNKKDYNKAEIFYKKALQLDPANATNNGNFAVFLNEIRKDNVQAESYYLKALESDSNDANNYGNYASFLSRVLNDSIKAKPYFEKALELNPSDANNNGNYAQSLLAQGLLNEGEKYIDIAFSLNPKPDLESELWFYRWSHFPEKFPQAKSELDKLLRKGKVSENWSFQTNIEIAKNNKHPDLKLLIEYAEKISGIPH